MNLTRSKRFGISCLLDPKVWLPAPLPSRYKHPLQKKLILTEFTDHKHILYYISLGNNLYLHQTFIFHNVWGCRKESFPRCITFVIYHPPNPPNPFLHLKT